MGIDLRPRRAAPRVPSYVRANYVLVEFAWRYFDGTQAVHTFSLEMEIIKFKALSH